MHRILILFWLLLLSLTGPSARAQQAEFPGGLVTAGTSAQDANGTWFGYVRWTPVSATVTQGKAFAVYLKPGQPADAGDFARQGVVVPREDAVSLALWLDRAQRLGESPAHLAEMVDELRRHYGDIAPSGPLAQRLGGLVHRALGDAATSAALRRVARTSPAVAFALGTAWAGPLGVPSGQWATVELREWNVAAQQDIAVIARIILRAAVPAPLLAPGAPVQVPDTTATGDLIIRTRWAMEDPLRRQLPLMSGYNLWRVRKAVAESLNWPNTPPTAAQLDARSLTSPTDTRRVNGEPPIAARALFRAGTVADFSPAAADPKLFFFADDNDRDLPGGVTFSDGEEFYYFAAARDLLNRSGLLSPGGLGMACRRMPPSTPTGLALQNGTAGTSGALLGVPCLHLRWHANVSTPTDTTHRYEILRAQIVGGILTSVSVLRDPAELAALTPLATVPAPTTPEAEIVWTDTTLALPDDYGRTFWYAVRAVYDGACGPVYSSPTSPVYGVLTRPDAAEAAVPGCTVVNCAFGGALALAVSDQANAPQVAAEERHLRITAQRADAGVIAVNLTVAAVSLGVETVILDESIRFDADDNNVATELILPQRAMVQVRCRAVLASGEEGSAALTATELNINEPATLTRLVPFQVAARAASDLMPGNGMDVPFFAASAPYPLTVTPGLEDSLFSGSNAALPDGTVVIYRPAGQTLVNLGPACVAAGRCSFSDPDGQAPNYLAYLLVPRAPGAVCRHAGEGADGRIVPVQQGFDLTPRTTEYRLYRRVNDGPLDLVRQARKDYNAAFPHVTVADGGLPATCSYLDYFVQLIDRDGHAGALTPLPPRILYDRPPPRPTLGDPEMIGDLAAPKVRLIWSCPPESVERFEILLTEQQSDATTLAGVAVPGSVLQTGSATIRSMAKSLTQFHTSATGIFVGRGLAPQRAQERILTGRVGEDFAAGPEFTLELAVSANRAYEVTLRALTTTGCLSEKSVTRDFTWKPAPLDQRVPWPARPVPAPAPFNDGIRPEEIVPLAGFRDRDVTGDDYALGVRIGRARLPAPYARLVKFIRSTPQGQRPVFSNEFFDGLMFEAMIYPFAKGPAGKQAERLLPVVLYRKQVPNTLYPDASGDLLQCSPLVENVQSAPEVLPNGSQQTGFTDNVITLTYTNDLVADIEFFTLYLLDTQPYVRGAKYHYYLVRFTGDGEIQQMIDAGAIDVPTLHK